jgi:hypothetical protein
VLIGFVGYFRKKLLSGLPAVQKNQVLDKKSICMLKKNLPRIISAVIWKEQVALVVGAASSRYHLVSRVDAAPTGVLLW